MERLQTAVRGIARLGRIRAAVDDVSSIPDGTMALIEPVADVGR